MTHIQGHQTEPVIPTDTPDLLASFRAYIRAARAAEMAWSQYRDLPSVDNADAALTAESAERTAREAHETALRAVTR